MKMRFNITNALPIVAAAYGRKFGIQVQVGGTCPYRRTHDHHPRISDDPLARTLAWGYLTHEAAHVRYTDFDAVTRIAAKGPLHRGILNSWRMFASRTRSWGPIRAPATLDAVIGWLSSTVELAAPRGGGRPPAVLVTPCWSWVTHRYRRRGPARARGEGGRARLAPDLSSRLRSPALGS